MKQVAKAAGRGQVFTVVRHAKPVFRIEPFRQRPGKGTLMDFTKIQFRTENPNLSKEIDKILYGQK